MTDRQTVETDRQTHLYLHLSIYPISSASLENPNTHTKTESLGVRIKNVYLTSFPSEPKLKKHLSNSLWGHQRVEEVPEKSSKWSYLCRRGTSLRGMSSKAWLPLPVLRMGTALGQLVWVLVSIMGLAIWESGHIAGLACTSLSSFVDVRKKLSLAFFTGGPLKKPMCEKLFKLM